MKRTKQRAAKTVVRGWKKARAVLERWRRNAATIQVELKQPRVIDVVPIDFLRGEPAEREGQSRSKFRGQLIFFTAADITIRRASGAILVIDNYEFVTLSDARTRLEVTSAR